MPIIQKREAGFTLVELLVVIIIIGILAAIAVPVFLNQRQRANDSSLKSDLRGAGQVLSTVLDNETQTWQAFIDKAGYDASQLVWYVDNNSGVRGETLPTSIPLWNDVFADNPITSSPGVHMTIAAIHTTNNPWTRAHDPGEFCILGMHKNSNYDWSVGSTHADYDRILFYDSSIGKVVELKDIHEALQDGQQSACYVYPGQYLAAGGSF